MVMSGSNHTPRPSAEPVILDFNDTDYPPEPIVPVPMEERFRDVPTPRIRDYLDMGVLTCQPLASGQLARRGDGAAELEAGAAAADA